VYVSGSVTPCVLDLRIQIPRGGGGGQGCLSRVNVVCRQGGGLCENPMTCPEESYRQWYIIVCDLKLSIIKRPWPALGCRAEEKKKCTFHSIDFYETRACCTGFHKALYTEFREILIRGLVAET
jgi:hypothetical protein